MIHGIGVDIVEIKRIERAITRWGDAFLHRIFHDEEIAYAQKFASPYPHYAARFAVKEAVYKALGVRTMSWKDMKVTNDQQGKPTCHCAKLASLQNLHISISHSKHYAIANAVVTIT